MRCERCQGTGYLHYYDAICDECFGSGIVYCCDEAGSNAPNEHKPQVIVSERERLIRHAEYYRLMWLGVKRELDELKSTSGIYQPIDIHSP